MRIIENNNTIEVTCQHCKSKLAVAVGDLKDAMTVGTYVTCAACDRTTTVPFSDIPKHWLNKIEWDE